MRALVDERTREEGRLAQVMSAESAEGDHRQRLGGVASKGPAPVRRGVEAMHELGEATLVSRAPAGGGERVGQLAGTICAPLLACALASASVNNAVAAYAPLYLQSGTFANLAGALRGARRFAPRRQPLNVNRNRSDHRAGSGRRKN